MLVEVGIAALFISFLTALIGTLAAFYGAVRDENTFITAARNAFFTTLPLLTIASVILMYAQYVGIYEIDYVSSVSKDAQPDLLKITAMWGGQAGSLLLWTWMLSLFTVLALIINWRREYRLMPWVMVAAGGTLLFFLVLNNFYENPFARSWAMSDDSIEISVLKPNSEAVIAYPYQWSGGQTYFLEKDRVIPQAPEARYDGRGLNPLLRHPGMIIHPPMLYLGFTGFVIPFAFSIAALVRGDIGSSWMRATRRWSLVAWMFLSLGLILGGRWAYDVLGWGGYWGWDPVENSTLLPWLTGTAFIHSVMIQEKRGMLKGWNVLMIILTYLLVLFGTVATRTGLLSSVHSFAESPLSVPMGIFLGGTMLLGLILFLWRGNQGMFEGDHDLESLFSRESLFLFNNWLFLAITVVVFWGTWSELITGMMRDGGLMSYVINLGPEYYEMIIPWLFLGLFILMGVAPLAAWRRASAQRLGISLRVPILLSVLVFFASAVFFDLSFMQDGGIAWSNIAIALGIAITAFAGFATLQEIFKGIEARHRAHGEPWILAFYRLLGRNRRRYGGYIIHLSIVIIGIGIIASSIFQEVRQETLNPGQLLSIGDYTMRYDQLSEATANDGRGMVVADVTLLRDGREVTTLRPRRDFFGSNSSPMTIAGVHSTIENDVYVLLTFWEGNQVTFRVYRNPLVNLIWWGSLLLVIGTTVSVYPNPQPQTVQQRRTIAKQTIPAGAGD